MSNQKQKPEIVFKSGRIRAAVFKHEVDKDGRTEIQRQISIQKRIKDGDNWRSTETFFPNELPQLVLVTQKAYEFRCHPRKAKACDNSSEPFSAWPRPFRSSTAPTVTSPI